MAAMTLEDWLAHLKPAETPVFRHTRDTLLQLAPRRDNLSAREVAIPILSDPLATLRLIYAANNRASRHFNAEVTTVEHAVLMQGTGSFLDRFADAPVLEDTPQGRDAEILGSLYRLARLAQHAAWQARDFATLNSDLRGEELQVAAVLYYAPEFLFWLDAPDIADRLARLRRELPSAEAEAQSLGFALEPLRQMLLHAWKIPDGLCDLLDERHAALPRQAILHATLNIANLSRFGWWDECLQDNFRMLAHTVRLPEDEVIGIVHGNAVRAARSGHWNPAPPAAAVLPMLPGDWPHEPEARPAEGAPRTEAGAEPAAVLTHREILAEALANIEGHLDGSLTLNQMMAIVLKGLHSGLGLSRVLFALITPDSQRVKCRFTLGIRADDPLRHFELELQSPDLFGQLMQRMQAVWMNADNRGRLWPRVAPGLRARIGLGDFYAMSLFGNGRPLGLIYADRGHGRASLDAATYNDFKAFCLEAAKGMGRVRAGPDQPR